MAREVDLRDVPAALREYQPREGKLLIRIGQVLGTSAELWLGLHDDYLAWQGAQSVNE